MGSIDSQEQLLKTVETLWPIGLLSAAGSPFRAPMCPWQLYICPPHGTVNGVQSWTRLHYIMVELCIKRAGAE